MGNVINIDNYLRLNVQDTLMILLSTFLIVILVKKFFWKYAKEYLDARKAYIQSQLDESVATLNESEVLKGQYEERMEHAKEEASEILSMAKERAAKEASDILSKASAGAALMKEKASLDIEREKSKIKAQMKEEISEVAFMAARKVVAKELDEKTRAQYVEDFIDKAGDETWQA